MSDTRDHEWLLIRERGGDVSHVAAATRAPYDELGELLAKLPGVAPRAGWQQRVFDAIDEGDAVPADAVPADAPALAPPKPVLAPPKPARRRQWIAAGAVAMAAAAAIAIYVARRPAPLQLEALLSSEPPSQLPPSGDQLALLTAEVRDGDGTPRGRDGVRLNDKYAIRLETTGPAELRLYGDTQELLATCSGGEPGCTIERDGERRRFSFEVVLRWPGEVRLVAFAGARIPASTGELARDLDEAARAGIEPRLEPPIVVR